MDEEDACSTPYHNFSPSPQYRPGLGVRHSMHATSAENVRSATLLQHRNPLYRELLLYKIPLCPVFWTCRSLKMLLCVPKLLTSQSSLPFFSLVRTSVLSLPSLSLPPRSLPQAPVPALRLLSLVQQRLPLLCTMLHLKPKLPTNAPVSPMPRNLSHPSLTPQLSKLRKATSALQGLTTHRKKLPTADRLQLVYVGGILRKPIREVKQNLMDLGFDTRASSIANISFLGASTCELLIRLGPLATSNGRLRRLTAPIFASLKTLTLLKLLILKHLQRSSLPWSIATPSASTLSLAAKVHLQRSASSSLPFLQASHCLSLQNPPGTMKMRFRCQLPQWKLTTSLTPNPPKKLMVMSLLFQWRPTHLLYLLRLSILNPQVLLETSSGYSVAPHTHSRACANRHRY
ncbi:hypothetical protein DSO57_1026456 [Entomophthora muscae]|uniref:Uncharacterized protein n=1 Tax=Entomophthora muscae TaxID=34485 RepID=A0ACC2T237_9FUNG|nr:hypothetical protein DSO57_1026456 [Entomophthora muscae]